MCYGCYFLFIVKSSKTKYQGLICHATVNYSKWQTLINWKVKNQCSVCWLAVCLKNLLIVRTYSYVCGFYNYHLKNGVAFVGDIIFAMDTDAINHIQLSTCQLQPYAGMTARKFYFLYWKTSSFSKQNLVAMSYFMFSVVHLILLCITFLGCCKGVKSWRTEVILKKHK